MSFDRREFAGLEFILLLVNPWGHVERASYHGMSRSCFYPYYRYNLQSFIILNQRRRLCFFSEQCKLVVRFSDQLSDKSHGQLVNQHRISALAIPEAKEGLAVFSRKRFTYPSRIRENLRRLRAVSHSDMSW